MAPSSKRSSTRVAARSPRVLIQNGTLKLGDAIVVGSTFGRVKAMTDYLGQKISEAGPSTPVEVLGLSDVPGAGDKSPILSMDERVGSRGGDREPQRWKHRAKTYVVKARGLTLRTLAREAFARKASSS